MTEIVFYTGVADAAVCAVRLATKLYEEGRRVRVHTPDAAATQSIDRLLWTHSQGSFVPHCQINAAIALDTPVWVDHAHAHAGGAEHADVLINLADEMPEYFARFVRVADIVGATAPQVSAGRVRFKQYKQHGYTIVHHDLTGKV